VRLTYLRAAGNVEEEFNKGFILPPLIVQLRKILDQYPDDTQILRVSSGVSLHLSDVIGKLQTLLRSLPCAKSWLLILPWCHKAE